MTPTPRRPSPDRPGRPGPSPRRSPGDATGTATGTPTGAPAIELRDLRRTYGRGSSAYDAVRGVDLEVAAGSVTALLGTNGAGKTSTLELVEGLAAPTGGEVRVLGLDPVADRARVRPRTGVLLQSSGFPADLTVRETLRMWAATVSAPRPVEESLERLTLTDRADVRVGALSGGEQRRLDLACTLMGRPEVVLLDEPTTGLDPESRRDVWQIVRDLRDDGAAVLLTTTTSRRPRRWPTTSRSCTPGGSAAPARPPRSPRVTPRRSGSTPPTAPCRPCPPAGSRTTGAPPPCTPPTSRPR